MYMHSMRDAIRASATFDHVIRSLLFPLLHRYLEVHDMFTWFIFILKGLNNLVSFRND